MRIPVGQNGQALSAAPSSPARRGTRYPPLRHQTHQLRQSIRRNAYILNARAGAVEPRHDGTHDPLRGFAGIPRGERHRLEIVAEGGVRRQHLHIPGRQVVCRGIPLLARGRQRHDVNLVVRHLVPNGTSRQVWRSVADDKAACSVAARVEVARHAQKTDGEQSLKGLLLSRSATINAKPELEIFADDVKCAHGATVGELDRAALFYLESRGVTPDEAKGLLTRAFVADALDRIGEERVREAFYADAEGWFG